MKVKFMPAKDNNDEQSMHSKSDNTEIINTKKYKIHDQQKNT